MSWMAPGLLVTTTFLALSLFTVRLLFQRVAFLEKTIQTIKDGFSARRKEALDENELLREANKRLSEQVKAMAAYMKKTGVAQPVLAYRTMADGKVIAFEQDYVIHEEP